MSKMTRETLRQMISEEISKLDQENQEKVEAKSVKVTAEQLRGIILQEVSSLNEKDEDSSIVPSDATEIDEHDKKYSYAVNDEGVWFWQKAKGKETAKKFDPVKHAVAIRKLLRWANRPANRNTAGAAREDLQTVAASLPERPASKAVKDFNLAFTKATEDENDMSADDFLLALEKTRVEMGVPDFRDVPQDEIEKAVKHASQDSVVDEMLPKLRKLKTVSPRELAPELFEDK